jgi:heme/copper-type cytochrome/quinol oxidase subunit 2
LDPEVISQLYNSELSSAGLSFSTEGSGTFDSYLLSDDELSSGLTSYRLLTVDNHLFIPTEMDVRAIVTASDVLHSWAVPALGVKIDACPGRLNQTSLFIRRDGFYYGQCSEICGVNHGFMPIGIVSYDIWPFSTDIGFDFESLLVSLQALVSR